jgi:hypothetical protein
MSDVQYSDDGQYWWDGSAWQPVENQSSEQQSGDPHAGQPSASGESESPEHESTEAGQLSPDGQWRWDGSQWQPADGSGSGGSSGLIDVSELDMSNFPALSAFTQYANDESGDAYLADLGITDTGEAYA